MRSLCEKCPKTELFLVRIWTIFTQCELHQMLLNKSKQRRFLVEWLQNQVWYTSDLIFMSKEKLKPCKTAVVMVVLLIFLCFWEKISTHLSLAFLLTTKVKSCGSIDIWVSGFNLHQILRLRIFQNWEVVQKFYDLVVTHPSVQSSVNW